MGNKYETKAADTADVEYGDSIIVAIGKDKWAIPGGWETTSRQVAINWAIAFNEVMGGTPTAAQRLDSGSRL